MGFLSIASPYMPLTKNKMQDHCLKEGRVWVVTVSGEPLGWTIWGDSASKRMLEAPGSLPTMEAAEKVARAFEAWIKKKHPRKVVPKGAYFVALADGPTKVAPSRKGEEWRRRIGNQFADQADAYTASQALAWLCAKERERFEMLTCA